MKKYIIPILAALAALASCNKEDFSTPVYVVPSNYIIKVLPDDIPTAVSVLKCNDTTGRFYAKNDYEAMQLVSKLGVDYELYKESGKLISTSFDNNQRISADRNSVINDITDDFTISGMTMSVYSNLQQAGTRFTPLDICGEGGEPLTTIRTSSNYWSSGDDMDMERFSSRDYCATADLCKDGGVRSFYIRLFFGGRNHWDKYKSNPLFYMYDDEFDRGQYQDEALPPQMESGCITGLRLVSGENPDLKIVDPATGITWRKCPVYYESFSGRGAGYEKYGEGDGDLNNGAKGDYLYLYYTKDTRTGRKITITSPFLAKYEKSYGGSKYSTLNNGDDALAAYSLMSTILTWYSPNWKCYPSSMLTQLADKVANSKANDLAEYIRPGAKQRVDFVLCYDKNMNPLMDDDKDGLPDYCGNFNRNAKGDVEIFLTYTFVTPEDKYWNNY